MLSTVLQRLEGLLSKQFIVASVFPILIATVVNIAIAWSVDSLMLLQPRAAIPLSNILSSIVKVRPLSQLSAVGVFVVFSSVLIGYLFSACNQLFREILEGQHLPERLRRAMTARQQRRISHLQSKIDNAKRWRRSIVSQGDAWIKALSESRAVGSKSGKCSYSQDSEAARQIASLRRFKSRYQTIEPEDLASAVKALQRELEKNCAQRQGLGDQATRLDQDHQDLGLLIDYAMSKLQNAYLTHYDRRQFNFPKDNLAPTALGNIANSVRSYAESRYSLHLDVLWTRFQNTIQKQASFYVLLQDAKADLDFMISMFWLTLMTTAFWTAMLLHDSKNLAAPLLALLLGILVCAAWYRFSIQSYRSFADLLRSAVDLYRFELLRSLHIPLPADSSSERQVWEQLSQSVGFGDPQHFSYIHESPKDTATADAASASK